MIKKFGMRPLIGLLFFVLILLVVGVLMQVKFSSLFQNYVEKQVAFQAENYASAIGERFVVELKALAGISANLSADPQHLEKMLSTLKDGNDEYNYGVVALNGNHIYSDGDQDVRASEFKGISESFHGSRYISYYKGKGLMFSVPVYSGKNVRYVLYRLYKEEKAVKNFAIVARDMLSSGIPRTASS